MPARCSFAIGRGAHNDPTTRNGRERPKRRAAPARVYRVRSEAPAPRFWRVRSDAPAPNQRTITDQQTGNGAVRPVWLGLAPALWPWAAPPRCQFVSAAVTFPISPQTKINSGVQEGEWLKSTSVFQRRRRGRLRLLRSLFLHPGLNPRISPKRIPMPEPKP
ncbi:hypothetical protein DPEC_G00287300 [Dallia pectoralis]|uniref:Uncharacterized protein n=1 Tax=Dallia pectoralis TaxID=75939 RepID=A0ACC2FKA5_DALPE|nr:hypothetical protein DPEC_G00287300 [Dallia pectoralis]